METISYTAARARLSGTMNHVCDDHVPIVITRTKAEPVVMISLEDYKAMAETFYLLKNPANAKRLANSIDEIEILIAKKKSKT